MIKRMFNIKRNVFLTWFLSYLLLIILSISISGFAYLQSTQLIKKEIEKSHTSTLQQLKQSIDSKLNDIFRIVKEINFNNRNVIIMNSGQNIEDYKRYILNQLNYDVRIFKLANSFIDNISIIYWNSDIALCCNGTSDIKQFYNFYFKDFDLTYNNWNKMMLKMNKNDFDPLHNKINYNKKNDDCIIYTKLLPLHIDKIEDVQATLCISIKKKTIRDMLNNLECFKDSTIFILDKNDNIIASNKDKMLFNELKYNSLTNEHSIEYKNINSKKIVLSYITADTTSWKYVLFTPTITFLSKFNYMRNLILISIILYLIVGIIIAAKLSQKNYMPVKKILQMFPVFSNIKGYEKQNEFNFIETSVKQLIKKEIKTEKLIQKQKLELKSVYLTKLIQGRIHYSDISKKLNGDYNIDLSKGKFALIGIHIDDYSSLKSDMIESNQKTLELVNFIFKNIINELSGNNNVYFVEMNNFLICLFKFNKNESEDCKEKLLNIISKTRNFIDAKLKIKYKIVLSRLYSKIENISGAYEEVLETMDIAVLTNSVMLDYENVINTKRNTVVDKYIIEKQELLIKAIRLSDFKTAKNYLADIFNKYLGEETYPIQMLQCRIYGLISSMLNAIEISFDKDFLENLNLTNRLIESKNIEQLYEEMNRILDEINVYMDNLKSDNDSILFDKVKNYVSGNYDDPNINVSVIAERLKCNSTYMSRVVKKNTGDSMLEYLHKYRIIKSKELIHNNNLTVKELAEQVGFYNSHAFIRVFKKYEGITPGKYIEKYRDKQ